MSRTPWFWIDAQLPQALAQWIIAEGARAAHVEELGLLRTPDSEIFAKARTAGAVVVTKDEDFVRLLEAQGAPPQVVWITVGNVRNPTLQALWIRSWHHVLIQLDAGEPLIEIADMG